MGGLENGRGASTRCSSARNARGDTSTAQCRLVQAKAGKAAAEIAPAARKRHAHRPGDGARQGRGRGVGSQVLRYVFAAALQTPASRGVDQHQPLGDKRGNHVSTTDTGADGAEAGFSASTVERRRGGYAVCFSLGSEKAIPYRGDTRSGSEYRPADGRSRPTENAVAPPRDIQAGSRAVQKDGGMPYARSNSTALVSDGVRFPLASSLA